MSDELLDLVDSNDNVIGTVWKSEAHQDNKLIHREVTIRIFNNRNQILLSQRSLLKKRFPGYWDISCAGHVGADESYDLSVKREVQEELGIIVTPIYLDKKLYIDEVESHFYSEYYAIYNGNEFNLQKEEVEAVEWVDIENFEDFSTRTGFDLADGSHKRTLEILKDLKTKGLI